MKTGTQDALKCSDSFRRTLRCLCCRGARSHDGDHLIHDLPGMIAHELVILKDFYELDQDSIRRGRSPDLPGIFPRCQIVTDLFN